MEEYKIIYKSIKVKQINETGLNKEVPYVQLSQIILKVTKWAADYRATSAKNLYITLIDTIRKH